MEDWVIGIDLGGTKTLLGLIGPDNRIVATCRIPTQSEEGPQAVIERIATQVSELEGRIPGGGKAAALGICTPGPVDHRSGALLTLVHLPGISNTPLRALLSERLGLPVRLDHDAKAAALGEFHYGVQPKTGSLVYIVIGTGVGAALIVDGRLYYGDSNSAGEAGHMTVDPNGEPCSCGSRGCLEVYTSGPQLARRYAEALRRAGQASDPGGPVNGERIAQLAAQGDPIARSVTDRAGEALGVAVASMAMVLNIEQFVVGGSVARMGDLLLGPARRTIPRYSFKAVGARVRIEASKLGDDAPILGCGWLARQALADARAGSS